MEKLNEVFPKKTGFEKTMDDEEIGFIEALQSVQGL